MTRLYLKMSSDTAKTIKTMTGHQEIEINLFWGSAGNSKRAGKINLDWPKGRDSPTLTVDVGEGVSAIILNAGLSELDTKGDKNG